MSHDGSSCKSYIKHPTEKERLDNLAFASFPEDYLPYASAYHQAHREGKTPPYLVWEERGARKRKKRRKKCCNTTALVSAIVLIVAAIMAVVAISVYLGVVTNLFRSPVLSLSAKFRVAEGDEFSDALHNLTSKEFLTKAENYQTMIGNAFLSSSLEPAFIAARIYKFRPGMLVYYRVYLDRRKLRHDDSSAIEMVKELMKDKTIGSQVPAFSSLVIDQNSIEISESEDWLGISNFQIRPTESDNTKSPTSTPPASSTTKASTPQTTRSSRRPGIISRKPHVRTTSTPVQRGENASMKDISSTGTGQVFAVGPISPEEDTFRLNYGQWHPVPIEDTVSPSFKDQRTPPGRGSVRLLEDRTSRVDQPPKRQPPLQTSKPQQIGVGSVEVLEDPMSHVDPIPILTRPGPEIHGQHQKGEVASSIMSSVSLVIRNNKNETNDGVMGVGSVTEDKSYKLETLNADSVTRKDHAAYRFLEEVEDSADNDTKVTVNEFSDPESTESNSTSLLEYGDDDEDYPDVRIIKVRLGVPFEDSRYLPLIDVSAGNRTNDLLSDDGEPMHEAQNETLTEEISDAEPQARTEDSYETTFLEPTPQNLNASFVVYAQDETTTNFSDEIVTETAHYPLLNMLNLTSTPEVIKVSSDMLSSVLNATLHAETTPDFGTASGVDLSGLDYGTSIDADIPDYLEKGHTTFVNDTRFVSEEINYTNDETGNFTVEFSSHTAEGHGFHKVEYFDGSWVSSSDTTDAATTFYGDEGIIYSTTSVPPPYNEEGLSYDLDVIQSGVPKIVPQLPDRRFNPNDIDSEDNAFVSGDDSLFDGITPESFDDGSREDETPEVTQVATTELTSEDVGKYPVFGEKRCTDDEMLCNSGECIPLSSRCDMKRDCKDNSDERNCICADKLKVMGQSQKICDGVEDCEDHTDEQDCPWCQNGQFICPQTKFCVNQSQVCDGTSDCPNGTDERNCVRLAESVASADSIHYQSEGYLMVRKQGEWGKLCTESVEDSYALKWKLDELGKAVCTSLTYRDLSGTSRVKDDQRDKVYFEISANQETRRRSSAIFTPSKCESKDVIRVKCESLECGLRPLAIPSRRRIVGGQSTESGSWPWQVALYKEGDFQCGAVLVSSSWLISAGHCFYSTQDAHWTARLGLLRRGSELQSPFEEIRRIERIILNPDYIDKGFINDIALLKLDKPVSFSDYLRPVCIPEETEDASMWHGKQCSVVGWGKLFEIGHTFPDSLQEVHLPVISTEECRKKILFLTMYHITDNMFCAGYERGGRDACLGDSGGPLMCQRQDGRWILLGVTSNGDGCGRPGRPGVYTKVTQYLPWIHQTMSTNFPSLLFEDNCEGVRCRLGRCIPRYKVCDGRWDCSDGSDEDFCLN